MRERSGLEQQLLVNGSEIRRLELNRNATEKHLEQERREEGKRQAEESRQPKSEQPLNPERSVAEQPVQTRKAVGGKERKLLDIPKIPQISEIFTWTGIALAILILIDPFSWNRAVCTVLGLVILTGTLMGRTIKRKKEGTASDQSSDSATAGAGSSSCDRGGRKENTDRKSAGRDPGVVLSDLGGRIL